MENAYLGDAPAPYEQITITLSDGVVLTGRLWLPERPAAAKVPVVLEWIPYRQSDNTAVGDSMVHGYFAMSGIASVRVDLRGSGNSEGLLHDEYLKQEQDDACEVIAWLAAQEWCNGKVGLIGISWGGFAGLQIAARRPPALKAIVTCCSTDDRYSDDVHFMGGGLLIDGLQWGAGLFAQLGRPADPAHVGARWRDIWMNRLENLKPPLASWLAHMQRDDFWKHGSICEDYDAIRCPVYAVTGWTDGYSDPVLRLMQNLKGPRKGLIGPWTHMYPNWGVPGPKIGFLEECMRWWRHWLLDEPTGIMDEPMLRLWVGEDLSRIRGYPPSTVAGSTYPIGRARARRRPSTQTTACWRRLRLSEPRRCGSPRRRISAPMPGNGAPWTAAATARNSRRTTGPTTRSRCAGIRPCSRRPSRLLAFPGSNLTWRWTAPAPLSSFG